MKNQDLLENQGKRGVYLGIGSNIGNRFRNIDLAKYYLNTNNIKILKTSSYYESLSWPNSNYPKFINIVLKVFTNLEPIELLKICRSIEILLGRKKNPKNYPRECDIDIIDFNNLICENEIILPHKSMHQRNFVLIPLFEINKNWTHPVSKISIKKMIFSLSTKDIRSIKQI
ncbi:MAG: 2-amino-4-hydroxy-6-hydroxymethyldihydropteridine diphosphokinase [Pelagibacteraceae bacterium]|nr:2-amino-4-hydroxy-6-hydroxymethyldihydropteridine diphosphokinase [Pelagibacteraceae bacterium]PHX88976.1 MAG: 2-amino-4-hydroxy-6-hydroxymethyldihydropteridine diphosphokinase [Pelagibacteraceae bacterium]